MIARIRAAIGGHPRKFGTSNEMLLKPSQAGSSRRVFSPVGTRIGRGIGLWLWAFHVPRPGARVVCALYPTDFASSLGLPSSLTPCLWPAALFLDLATLARGLGQNGFDGRGRQKDRKSLTRRGKGVFAVRLNIKVDTQKIE